MLLSETPAKRFRTRIEDHATTMCANLFLYPPPESCTIHDAMSSSIPMRSLWLLPALTINFRGEDDINDLMATFVPLLFH